MTDNGGRGASDRTTIIVGPAPDAEVTFETRVGDDGDDAEEDARGRVRTGSSDLELTFDAGDQTVGIRFRGVEIPPGATILAAHLQFQVDETDSAPTALILRGEASDDAAPIAKSAFNLSSRALTSASATWSPAPWTTRGEAGVDQRTPDLRAVIQEIVDRPGWASGNAVAILITGSGKRTAESFDGVASAAPLLHVRYRNP